MGGENPAEKALILLRTRLCDPNFIFRPLCESSDSNYSKLKFLVSSSITEGCNNSILLLGPRGSGKIAVLGLVIGDLLQEYPDSITVIRLSGLLHSDDADENCALKASFDENSQFLIAMLRLLEHILLLSPDSSLPTDYVVEFNTKLQVSFSDYCYHGTRFRAVSNMDLQSGMLSLESFKTALSNIQRLPKMECIKDCSILELYLLICMKRLEVKEQNSYNFTAVMKEYKCVHDSFQTSDYYAKNVCLRAFEHLLQRGLIEFMDNRGQNQSVEYRPVKLLISFQQLLEGLKSYRSCPLSRYASSPKSKPALRFFRWVQSHPDVTRSEFVFCVMLEILARNHMILQGRKFIKARELFDEMLHNGLDPDRFAYNTPIVGELGLGDPPKAFNMQAKGFPPDLFIYNVFVDVICKLGNLKEAYIMVQKMIRNDLVPDHRIASMYFSEMQEKRVLPNIVTYNALINGLCKVMRMDQAYEFFTQMEEKGQSYSVTSCIHSLELYSK
ncbi:hypothetical protein ACLB2K_042644 [Fragaria x ananassa]